MELEINLELNLVKRQELTISVRWSGAKELSSGDWKGARRSAQRVLRIDPGHLGALEVLAQSTLALGLYEEVLGLVRKLIRVNPNEPAYEIIRATALQGLSRLPEALDSLVRAHQLSKDATQKSRVMDEIEFIHACLRMQNPSQGFPTSTPGIVNQRPVRPAIPILS